MNKEAELCDTCIINNCTAGRVVYGDLPVIMCTSWKAIVKPTIREQVIESRKALDETRSKEAMIEALMRCGQAIDEQKKVPGIVVLKPPVEADRTCKSCDRQYCTRRGLVTEDCEAHVVKLSSLVKSPCKDCEKRKQCPDVWRKPNECSDYVKDTHE